MISIGEMRHQITFQQESRADDDGGGAALTWADIATDPTVWAKVEPLSGNEALRGMQLEARVTHRITMRQRLDITAKMRVKFSTDGGSTYKYFNIRGITHKEFRGRWTEIMADEGGAI